MQDAQVTKSLNPENFHPCKGTHGNKYGILINPYKLSRCSSLSSAPIIGFPGEGDGLPLVQERPTLTLFRSMEFSIKLHSIKSGWSILHIEGSQVIVSYFFSFWEE